VISPRQLKQLAELTLQEGKVNPKIAGFALKKLPSRELKSYLFYLRQALRNSRVNVAHAGEMNDASRKELSKRFAGREMIFTRSDALGGGIEIEYEDNIMKLSIRNLLEQTVERLKESL
jgi:hypothetical protein